MVWRRAAKSAENDAWWDKWHQNACCCIQSAHGNVWITLYLLVLYEVLVIITTGSCLCQCEIDAWSRDCTLRQQHLGSSAESRNEASSLSLFHIHIHTLALFLLSPEYHTTGAHRECLTIELFFASELHQVHPVRKGSTSAIRNYASCHPQFSVSSTPPPHGYTVMVELIQSLLSLPQMYLYMCSHGARESTVFVPKKDRS